MTITQRGTLKEAIADNGKALRKQNGEEVQYAYSVCPFHDDWQEVDEAEKLAYEAAQAAKQAEELANENANPEE